MKEKIKAKKELAKKHIDKKILRQLIIYFFVSLGMLGFVVYEIVVIPLHWWLALIVIAIGFGLGLLTRRIFKITWHEDEQKVISRVDRLGGTILVLYILFSIFRTKIVEQFFNGPLVLAITMSLVFGLMAGRMIGMKNKIVKILKEQEIIG